MKHTTAAPAAVAASGLAWWRTVLGEYPTGVTLITSIDDDGQPVGMIVGTFNAVSESPPLVGYMPTLTSWTSAQILGRGRFAASVLGVHHETICRAFATRAPDRFELGSWVDTGSGLPRLADAVSWFEADIANVVEVGDHSLVVGEVTEFGVGDGRSGLPLLYLKGGYGSFAIPSPRLDYQRLSARMRLANGMREALNAFAAEQDVVVTLATVSGDSVVILAAEGGNGPDASDDGDIVGSSFPFAAPLAPGLVAWSDADRQKAWIENSRHLIGRVDRPALADILRRVRERGFAVSLGSAMADRFDAIAADPGTNRAELVALWADVDQETTLLEQGDGWHAEVSSIQVPVFGADGDVDMELAVTGFGGSPTKERIEAIVLAAQQTAALLSALAGAPAD